MKRTHVFAVALGVAGGVAIAAEISRPAYLATSVAWRPKPVAVPRAEVLSAPRTEVLAVPELQTGVRGGARWAVAQLPVDAEEPEDGVTADVKPTIAARGEKKLTVKSAGTKAIAAKALTHGETKGMRPVLAKSPMPRVIAHAAKQAQVKVVQLPAVVEAPNTVPHQRLTLKQKISKMWIGLKSKFKHKPTV